MKYTLYYTNSFGHIFNPDGSMYDNRKGKPIIKEFYSLESAIEEANRFVEANPLLECMIFSQYEPGKPLIIADYESQSEEYKNHLFIYNKTQKQRKRKRKKIIFISLIVVMLIFLFCKFM